MDTFEFFIERMQVEKGQNLLLVTSCIYVPFQLLKFIPIALERELYVDCIGVSAVMPGSSFSNASNYCQEIKATINAISIISDKYFF